MHRRLCVHFTTILFPVISFLALSNTCSPRLGAQDSVRPYDGLDAGREAYENHEVERQRQIARQLNTIDQMKWYSGIPPRYDDYTVYYRSPPSSNYAYATGQRGIFGTSPRARGVWPYDIFEPWPYIPGDIWGYRWDDSVRQPIGQRQVQTGPNRWESHPVYAAPLSPLAPLETRAAESPRLLSPPDPTPAPTERRRPTTGPREF